jgi:hypothetical protein
LARFVVQQGQVAGTGNMACFVFCFCAYIGYGQLLPQADKFLYGKFHAVKLTKAA